MAEAQSTVSAARAADEIGPQYARDDEFKARARLHQSKFRAEHLNANWVEYGNRLAREDALAGKNFYSGYDGRVFDEVQKRYPLAYTPLYYDMLRSQHIPWNFFIPLKVESDFAVALLNLLFQVKVREIGCVRIEYAPDPREHFLNDNTSFDAYVEYVDTDSNRGGFGIEVKYTEREYSYGKTEKKMMFNPSSRYNTVSRSSGLYGEGSAESLNTRKVKQLWRNQLLGESILQHPHTSLKRFTSVVIYPNGNKHYVEACRDYSGCLRNEIAEEKFKEITFERFIEAGKSLATETRLMDWLRYLEARYIVQKES